MLRRSFNRVESPRAILNLLVLGCLITCGILPLVAAEASTPLTLQISSETNPAQQGSIVTFYATGWQTNFSSLADGQLATMAQNVCPAVCQAVPSGSVLYGGASPGIVAGVSQLNIQIGTIHSSSTSPFLFSFYVAGPSGDLSQAVWVTPDLSAPGPRRISSGQPAKH